MFDIWSMPFSWLHISDLHLQSGDAFDRGVVLNALLKSTRNFRRVGRTVDAVFFTGDVAHSGKSDEYKAATLFFDALLEAVGLQRERLFVIPGNHDVDRDRVKWLARTLQSREDSDAYFAPGEPPPISSLGKPSS